MALARCLRSQKRLRQVSQSLGSIPTGSIVLYSSLLCFSSVCSNLPLYSSSEFSFQIYTFQFQNFFHFFLFSISLLIFSFCSYTIFLNFSISSFSSLSIFYTVVLRLWSTRFSIMSFQGEFMLFYSFPLNGPYFLVFLYVL